ncbi:hypothetical protein HAX54_049815 [Datura stramonium]|uniref:Uncharacterized protein n=1 Tax=Datura stramonium TaxID=4076 RepID=A0ABS8WMU8_DATST|nr:hypothetical protein [Datura stramonium]
MTIAAQFYWAVVRLRLFLIGGDNTLVEDRAMLVASLMSGLPFNMGLCREAHVPILAGIDVETYATKNAFITQPKGESAETSSFMLRSSQYVFTQEIFAQVVRKVDRQDKQLKLFAEQLGPFVNQAITTTLEPYKHLHVHMTDMEFRVNDRLKDLIVPELARVAIELKKAQNDILKLQQERQLLEFLIGKFEESEDYSPFIDLLGEQLRQPEKSRLEEETHIKKMRARVGGSSFSSAPQVERHVTRATIHSELTTLITPPLSTEATTPDPLSATTSTEATANGPRVIPP